MLLEYYGGPKIELPENQSATGYRIERAMLCYPRRPLRLTIPDNVDRVVLLRRADLPRERTTRDDSELLRAWYAPSDSTTLIVELSDWTVSWAHLVFERIKQGYDAPGWKYRERTTAPPSFGTFKMPGRAFTAPGAQLTMGERVTHGVLLHAQPGVYLRLGWALLFVTAGAAPHIPMVNGLPPPLCVYVSGAYLATRDQVPLNHAQLGTVFGVSNDTARKFSCHSFLRTLGERFGAQRNGSKTPRETQGDRAIPGGASKEAQSGNGNDATQEPDPVIKFCGLGQAPEDWKRWIQSHKRAMEGETTTAQSSGPPTHEDGPARRALEDKTTAAQRSSCPVWEEWHRRQTAGACEAPWQQEGNPCGVLHHMPADLVNAPTRGARFFVQYAPWLWAECPLWAKLEKLAESLEALAKALESSKVNRDLGELKSQLADLLESLPFSFGQGINTLVQLGNPRGEVSSCEARAWAHWVGQLLFQRSAAQDPLYSAVTLVEKPPVPDDWLSRYQASSLMAYF